MFLMAQHDRLPIAGLAGLLSRAQRPQQGVAHFLQCSVIPFLCETCNLNGPIFTDLAFRVGTKQSRVEGGSISLPTTFQLPSMETIACPFERTCFQD